ncbi:Protocadherin-11 Y-linked [Bulinus truncatus]|nr:Protocadherin-11 Y-linked [Bulinus truncatus]
MKLSTLIFLTAVHLLLTTVLSQSRKSIAFNLVEEQPPNTFIGNVADESGLRNEVTQDVFDRLKYQILSSDSLRVSLLTINNRTGALYTNSKIDREKVCDASATTCNLMFDVTVQQDVSIYKVINVVVSILDINDNPPTFLQNQLQLSISEAEQIGSEMSIPPAIDRDSGVNAAVSYWMDRSEVFELKEEKLLDASFLKLVLLQNLDRETQSTYNLLIFARDGNTSNALTGTLSVTVVVVDVNDNNPIFTQTLFNFSIQETATIGSSVGAISATDLDSGDNGRISYQFSSLTSSKVLQLFALNSETGMIVVKSELLYESLKFQAVVEAKDNGMSPRSSQATLIINVLDVGNKPPKLSLTLAESLVNNTILLSEDIPVGSFIGTIKYVDNDEGNNGDVDCISMNPQFLLQLIEDHGYAVEVKTPLDRESQPEMTVVLKCSDRGSPILSAFVNVTVRVKDVNDNSPQFADTPNKVKVAENIPRKVNLIKVSATDADEGVNKEFTYQLTANSSSVFSVDPITGWVSLVSPLDRETTPVIFLTVFAVDKGTPAMTGSTTVTVFVDDVNDNAPNIIRAEYLVKENEPPGSFVGQIVAQDSDDGMNAQYTFSLVSDPFSSFLVSESGVITTTKTFDREEVDLYSILVSVKDGGSPSLSSTSTLIITITDDNDHSPYLLYPIPGNDSINISANLSPGSVIARVVASDADLDASARLLYIIAEGNPTNIFSIDNTTGTIFVAKRLSQNRGSELRLTISVQDGGNPRMYNETFLYVNIDFTNATILGDAVIMDQKYVIIAGIIAGITVIITIIIITIIIILKRTDLGRCSEPNLKGKDPNHRHAPLPKDIAEVGLHSVPNYLINSSDKEAGFGDGNIKPRDQNTSFESFKMGGGSTYKPAPSMLAQDLLDPPSFSLYTETRTRATSDDHHSDSSGDVTTSDSGRGASDVEELSTGGTPPVNNYNNVNVGPNIVAPRVPPREPVATGAIPLTQRSTFGPVLPRDFSSLSDLSRSDRVFVAQNDLDKSRKLANKVRFTLDDEHRSSKPSQGLADQHRNIPVSQSTFGVPHPMNIGPKGEMGPGLSFLPPPAHQNGRSHGPHRYDSRDSINRSAISVPLSRDAIARHDRMQGAPLKQHLLSPNGYPPLQHQQQQMQSHQQQHQQQAQYSHRHVPLSSLNHSIDEDDDDGSTTTSGSYAIDNVDETFNNSVEC